MSKATFVRRVFLLVHVCLFELRYSSHLYRACEWRFTDSIS